MTASRETFSNHLGLAARVSAVMAFWFEARDHGALAELFDEVQAEFGSAFTRCTVNAREGDASARRRSTFKQWCEKDKPIGDRGLEFGLRSEDHGHTFRVAFKLQHVGRSKTRSETGYVVLTRPADGLDVGAFEDCFRRWSERLPIGQAQAGYAVHADLMDRGGIGDLCDEVEAVMNAHPTLGLVMPFDLLDDAVFTRRLAGVAWLVAVRGRLAKAVDGAASSPHAEALADGWLLRAGPHVRWDAELDDAQRQAWTEVSAMLRAKRVRARDVGGGPATAGGVLSDRAPFEAWLARFDGN